MHMFLPIHPVYAFGFTFTFKIIINMYDSMTAFFTVFGLFCVCIFLHLCFLPREVHLVFVVKMVWWCWTILTFACLESFWFLHQIWMRVFLVRIFLVIGSSLLSGWTYNAISFWVVEILLRNQLITLCKFPCMLSVVFPLLLLVFYPCL